MADDRRVADGNETHAMDLLISGQKKISAPFDGIEVLEILVIPEKINERGSLGKSIQKGPSLIGKTKFLADKGAQKLAHMHVNGENLFFMEVLER